MDPESLISSSIYLAAENQAKIDTEEQSTVETFVRPSKYFHQLNLWKQNLTSTTNASYEASESFHDLETDYSEFAIKKNFMLFFSEIEHKVPKEPGYLNHHHQWLIVAATTILPRDSDHVAIATQFGQYQLIHSAHKQAHQASVEEWVKTKKGPRRALL